MLALSQINATHALLSLSGTDLSNKSGVGITSLRRYELKEEIPSTNMSVLMLIKFALEEAGIQFTSDSPVHPGVTLHFVK